MARVYRFFIEGRAGELGSDLSIVPGRNDEILDQLVKVLRVKAGDNVVLLNSDNCFGDEGFEFSYEVVSAHKKELGLRFLEKQLCQNELAFPLELVLCLPNKPDKLSFILQKAVELGVSKVVLVEGDNSQMKHGLKTERLARVMKEAAEQSERAYVPDLEIERTLREYLESADRDSLFVAMERDDSGGGVDFGEGRCAIVIGPEGGFSDEEKGFVSLNKLKAFSLGKRILRMETAAVVALGLASIK